MGRRLNFAVIMLSLLVFLGINSPVSGGSGNLKVLIVTGQSNPYHDWRISTPILKQLLEETGLFAVDIAVNKAGENGSNFSPNFSQYNVVVLNYEGGDWPSESKEAFVKYVKTGGGVVVYHSADNAFPGWKEFNRIIGLGGWGGRDERWGPMVRYRNGKIVFDNEPGLAGTHPPGHDFQVINRDREHPVTKGLPEKWMHGADDLYSKLRGPAENLTVLATSYADPAVKNKWGQGTGEHEPMLFVVKYGKGRIFHTTLGHVNKFPMPSVRCVGFITTFQRGAEWAARGKVTQKVPHDFPTASKVSLRESYAKKILDDLLGKIASYEYGKSREPLSDLDNLIQKANPSEETTRQIEMGLAEFLQSNASLAGKQFACEKLSVIGTDASVGVLSKMLVKADTSDMARYALERMPGSVVDDALREALSKASGKIKVGIINTIGQRRDKKSADVLGNVVYDSQTEVASAAVSALGKIGGLEVASLLSKARKKTTGSFQEQVVHSR